jgi:hypothetical protein
MGKNKKIEKSIASFEKQKEEHIKKIEFYKGKNSTLIPYWEKEIEEIEEKIKKQKEKLNE